jgi:hypothetical protein
MDAFEQLLGEAKCYVCGKVRGVVVYVMLTGLKCCRRVVASLRANDARVARIVGIAPVSVKCQVGRSTSQCVMP